jgi:hypothetical protein
MFVFFRKRAKILAAVRPIRAFRKKSNDRCRLASMSFKRMKFFWITGLASTAIFTALFLIRMDWIEGFFHAPKSLATGETHSAAARESWMNIFQHQRRIGYSHTRLIPKAGGYELREDVAMRINIMGMVQDLRLRTRADLRPDLSLERFEFDIGSGRFRSAARGETVGGVLSIHSDASGSRRNIEVPLKRNVFLTATLLDRLQGESLKPGDRYTFEVFDPASMAQSAVQAEVIAREEIQMAGGSVPATRISMGLRGITQTAWISDSGELLRERGLLGMRLEKTTPEEALRDPEAAASQDLAEAAAVSPHREMAAPQTRESLRLRIGGIRTDGLHLTGGRQSFADGVLTVRREDLAALPQLAPDAPLPALERAYLKPEALIQSDHERIRSLVRSILGEAPPPTPLAKTRLLMDWIQRHIEKRPVLSLPDALSTLENRMGDCNEHAMLLAAMARSAGIPARVEAGLVYLNGKFYYHAWNLLFLGRWVTADALFGQLPADVTHLRLVTGSVQQQLDLAAVIGNITIEFLD